MGTGNNEAVNIIPALMRQKNEAFPSLSVRVPYSGLDSHGSLVLTRNSVFMTLPNNINALSRVFAVTTTRAVNCRRGVIVLCGVGNF